MKRSVRTLAVATALLATALAGCAFPGGSQTLAKPTSTIADQALDDLSGKVFSKGPNGETASPASSADLTDAEVAQVKSLGLKAAIVMHTGGDDWSQAQIAGLKSEFDRLGIELVATTDAKFDPKTQVANLQTVMAKDPDIIVSLPTDPVATASAYRAAADAGAKLVFMDNIPAGFEAGKDYVSVVSADNYGNGVISAHLMARALGGQGKIGVVFHDADFFVTRQRYDGFRSTIEQDYPGIEIVESKGVGGPDFATQAQNAASAMLSKHADLKGIWGVWDVPAEGVLAAARAAGRLDLKIATEDLGKIVAINMAKNTMVVGLGSLRPGCHRGPTGGRRLPRQAGTALRRAARAGRHSRERAGRLEAGLPRGPPCRPAELLRCQQLIPTERRSSPVVDTTEISARTETSGSSELAVQMRGIYKSFDTVSVLRDLGFEVAKGEVHALAGGNGAGKSTLMKILQGVYTPDRGEILLDGMQATYTTIHGARGAGIGMVFQEFSLIPTLTVAQNIYLTTEPVRGGGLINDREARRRAAEVFEVMGVDIDPAAVLGNLSTAYWQLTEIAKALAQDAQVLIMDEPTASLAKHETEALFQLVERLKARGISIVYISHRMDEVYRIADRITILRDGQRLFTKRLTEVTPAQIVEGIVGRQIEGELEYKERDRPLSKTALLEVRHLQAGNRVNDVSFTLHEGEILGLAGLMGSGRTELARVLFGIDSIDSGEVLVRGSKVSLDNPRDASQHGIALVPEDRRLQGLVLDHSVRDNLLLPLLGRLQRGPFVSDKAGKTLANDLLERFQVKVAHPGRPVRLLSGGNQQKVVIAKWLGTDPDVLIMDEPTAGVDIGTKSEILDVMRRLADAGKGVIVISSELPELLAVSDRVLVLRGGAIDKELDRAEIPDEESLQLAVQGV